MDTLLNEEQLSLESACEELLAHEWPLERALRAYGADGRGHDASLWDHLAATGWLGLPVREQLGGAGGSLIDLGLAYRAAGARLVPSTLYSCMFAVLLVDRVGLPGQALSCLPPIIQGRSLATVAYSEPHAAEEIDLWRTRAERIGGRWVLHGAKSFVLNLDTAEHVLVMARVHAGMDELGHGLFVVPRSALANIERQSSFGCERFFRFELEGLELPEEALLGGREALRSTRQAFADVHETAAALQCMEVCGGVREVLRRTIEYVKERRVQGRPVAANQAVQHMLANLCIRLNGVRVASLKALWAKSLGRPAPRDVAIAKIASGRLYAEATVTAHQLWGAMGYARETGLYLWTERARVTQSLFGTHRYHGQRVADALGLGRR